MDSFNVPSVKDLLETGAEKFNNSTFLKYVNDGNVVERSFTQVKEDSFAVFRWLRSISENKKNIAIVGKTSYNYLMFFTGVLLSGNVAIPFSPEISANEAAELFTRADVEIVIYENDFSEKIYEVNKQMKAITHMVNIDDADEVDCIYSDYSSDSKYKSLSDFEVNKDECAVIIFTSGTTGIKKGVMLSTNALVGNIMYRDYCTDIFNENDVSLSVLPMNHIYCFSGDYIKNLKDGLQVCLNGSLRDIADNLLRFEPKVVRVVPMIAQSLLQKIKFLMRRNPELSPREAAEKIYGRNIKWLISGGAYLNPELSEEYDKLGIYLRQGYGMTEAGCRISVPDENVSRESVGRVINICEARVENGEIQVKTPTAMLGYYKMPEETEKMFTSDGWLKTGDIGYVTDDNQLFITGRVKNLIILSNGENVSPEAIEKKFQSYEMVDEVLVYAENNMIIAEIYPDADKADENGIENIQDFFDDIADTMNSTSKKSHTISKVIIRDIPFEKTESGKIKRHKTII